MKCIKTILATSLLLFSMQFVLSQTYNKEKILSDIRTTKKILNKLHIPIRNNLNKDSPIILIVNPNLSLYNGQFKLGKSKVDIVYYNTDSAYLKNPIIEISPLLDSVYFKHQYTELIEKIKARGSLIHEISHYLNSAYDDKTYYSPIVWNKEELEKYIRHPLELPAYAAESYFFLKKTDKNKLKEILKNQIIGDDLYKKLVTEWYKKIYPWRPPIKL